MSGHVVLSRLSAGWSGCVDLTNNATGITAEVDPPYRTSPARIWADVVTRLSHLLNAPVRGWVTAADLKLHLSTSGGSFTLAASGTVESRLALTGTYSGVTSVTTASAVSNLVSPASTGVDVPAAAYATGAPAADGVLGVRPIAQAPNGGLVLYSPDYFSNSLIIEAEVDDGGTYDVFVDGRIVTRFRAAEVVRERWGQRATKAAINLSAAKVSL